MNNKLLAPRQIGKSPLNEESKGKFKPIKDNVNSQRNNTSEQEDSAHHNLNVGLNKKKRKRSGAKHNSGSLKENLNLGSDLEKQIEDSYLNQEINKKKLHKKNKDKFDSNSSNENMYSRCANSEPSPNSSQKLQTIHSRKKKLMKNNNGPENEEMNNHSESTVGTEKPTKKKKKMKIQNQEMNNILEETEFSMTQKFDTNTSKKKKKKGNMPEKLVSNFSKEGDESDFDIDSYPSDSEDELPLPGGKVNYADVSSDESSSSSSDNESTGTFDAESYPSDTEDEEDKKKGFPRNLVPSAELEEREERTIFVGNLPKNVDRKDLKKWFFKFGPVECVRLRSAPIADLELPRKVAVIKKTFHDSRSNISAYVRFKTVEAAENAIQANGATFEDHVIRVDKSVHKTKYDSNKAVFVGNIPFAVEESLLHKFFSDCGEIDHVRIIRDKNTGVGKGFGYVNFKCSSAVPLALKLDGETLEKRQLRIKPIKYQKKNAFLKKGPPPQYHNKKYFKKPFNKSKTPKKETSYQGEISQKKSHKQPKKKTAEDRKREKFSKILTAKRNKNK